MNNQIKNLPSLPGVYQIVNKTNLRVYIGQSANIKKRLREHFNRLQRNKHVNPHLQNAWNAYGEQNFFFGVLKIVHDQDKRNDEEQMWIDILFGQRSYNSLKSVVPITDEIRVKITKSKMGIRHSEDAKRRMSEARIGVKLSKEHKEKIGKAGLGKRHSEDVKRRMSEAHRGKVISDETRLKMRQSRLGKKASEETRKKLRARKPTCPMKGKTLSEEHKEALLASRRGKTHSEATRQKMREAARGRKRSEATRQKMREANLGRTLSDEHKQKIREAQKAYWESRKANKISKCGNEILVKQEEIVEPLAL